MRAALLVWRYPIFVLLMAVCLVALSTSPLTRSAQVRGMAEATGPIVGLALMLGSILLAAEAFISITVVETYGASIRGTTLDPRRRSHIMLTEMQAFVGAVFTAHITAVSTMYLISTRIEPHAKLPGIPRSAASIARRLLDCSYYALFTLLGANDPEPQGPAGRLATGAIGLQSFALLFVVLGVLASVRRVPMPPPAQQPNPASSPQPAQTASDPSRPANCDVARQRRTQRTGAVLAIAAGAIVVAAIIQRRAATRRMR